MACWLARTSRSLLAVQLAVVAAQLLFLCVWLANHEVGTSALRTQGDSITPLRSQSPPPLPPLPPLPSPLAAQRRQQQKRQQPQQKQQQQKQQQKQPQQKQQQKQPQPKPPQPKPPQPKQQPQPKPPQPKPQPKQPEPKPPPQKQQPQPAGALRPPPSNATPLLFLSGPEGSGHDALGGLLMRLPEVLPMSLVQEQSFVQLWWGNDNRGGADGADGADLAVLRSAEEAIVDWASTARASGRRLAFGARGCVRGTSEEGGDCSWVSGIGLQLGLQRPAASGAERGKQLLSAPLEWTGEAFAYPYMDTAAEPGGQRLHYPRLSDVARLALTASPQLRLRVIALHRPPLAALAHMAASRPERLWRPDGRDERLARLARQLMVAGRAAYEQLERLPPESVLVVDVDGLLSRAAKPAADAAIASLSRFTGLPAASVSAALGVAAADERARLQRLVKARKQAPLGTPEREALLTAALQAVGTGGERWSSRLSAALNGSALVGMLPHSAVAASAAKPHWSVAAAASDKAAAAASRVKLTHVINPFFAKSDEHRVAQRHTLASIAAAVAAARAAGVVVEVIAAVLPVDKGVVNATTAEVNAALQSQPKGAAKASCCGWMREVVVAPLKPAEPLTLPAALPSVKHKFALPLLPALLRAGAEHGSGSHLLYSNIDIALQADAYVELAALASKQPETPVSAVREEFEHADASFTLADAAARRGKGLPHPGHDLWMMPRKWVPSLRLGDVALGVSLVATALNQALLAKSSCRLTLLSRQLSYHVVEGESVVRHKWLQRARTDPLFAQTYTAWNCVHTKAALGAALTAAPAYGQCWFASQAAKSMAAYRCPAHVAKLPQAAQAIWDGGDARAAERVFPALNRSALASRGGAVSERQRTNQRQRTAPAQRFAPPLPSL